MINIPICTYCLKQNCSGACQQAAGTIHGYQSKIQDYLKQRQAQAQPQPKDPREERIKELQIKQTLTEGERIELSMLLRRKYK